MRPRTAAGRACAGGVRFDLAGVMRVHLLPTAQSVFLVRLPQELVAVSAVRRVQINFKKIIL